jgi:hypothetical protein
MPMQASNDSSFAGRSDGATDAGEVGDTGDEAALVVLGELVHAVPPRINAVRAIGRKGDRIPSAWHGERRQWEPRTTDSA